MAVPRPSPPSDPIHQSQHRRPPSSSHLASLLGVTALALAVLLGFGYLRMHRQGSARATVPVTVGSCVTEPTGEMLRAADCAAPEAVAKVTTVVGTGAGAECPADTDSMASAPGRVLCLVNLRAPHPGAPGGGGGIIRPGDCIDNPGTGRTDELACGDGGFYATVLARVDRSSQCRPPAAEAVALQVASRPVVCLRPRAQVGGCVGAVTVGPPNPVACTDPKAIGKVLARATSAGSCPLGTTRRLTAIYGLPGMKVICLGRPR